VDAGEKGSFRGRGGAARMGWNTIRPGETTAFERSIGNHTILAGRKKGGATQKEGKKRGKEAPSPL